MKILRDNKQFCAAILTDPQKHLTYLLLGWFDQEASKLTHRYLRDRSQKVKVGSSFNKELDILYGVGSILGSLIFNNISDLFFIDMSSISSCVGDTTPYECAPYYDKLKENLGLTIHKIFNWFKHRWFN